uniref:CD97 antigen-like n=1 Tax=Labrus bergylta TaxID=56723 RepID=A0A3Q3MB48_9LABR
DMHFICWTLGGIICILTDPRSAVTYVSGNEASGARFKLNENECSENTDQCGKHTKCFNTLGSFYCQCLEGYKNTGLSGQCQGQFVYHMCVCVTGVCVCNRCVCVCMLQVCVYINECLDTNKCGPGAYCRNTIGGYNCTCRPGYSRYSSSAGSCVGESCLCTHTHTHTHTHIGVFISCLLFLPLLQKLFTATDAILSPHHLDSSEAVSGLLDAVENSVRVIGPQLKGNHTKIETKVEVAVQRGQTPPTGSIHLTNENTRLDTDWMTAAGTGSYPGTSLYRYAMAALLTYKNLEKTINGSFEKLSGYEKDGVDPSFQIFSRVVSVVVSNPDPQNLSKPFMITLWFFVQDTEKSPDVSFICAFWTEGGAWSTHGCYQQQSNSTHTVCSCEHLSSFAVLMARYDMKHTFGLLLITKVGLTVSLLSLLLCILTFKFCRSIQGTRTTIHLHLCVCLFMADLVFLAGISQTKPEGGCRLVAAMLHFFFLGVFTWMLLEGVQLYRMVVLVFNATIRPLYLFMAGYGAPLVILILSAIIRPAGYGTDQHCWLSLSDGLIWSFFGPVCLIIILNIFFFIITVWKLAQKFSSLNPDLSKLHKVRAFTVTAIAQMCILGLMWVFGAFLFEEGPIVVAYVFTILNSLQGALVFIMHCLLSKQVREEYAHFLSCICTSQKKRYSDFSSTNPSSSQSQVSRKSPDSQL